MLEQFKRFPLRQNLSFLVNFYPTMAFIANVAHCIDMTKRCVPSQPNRCEPTYIGAVMIHYSAHDHV